MSRPVPFTPGEAAAALRKSKRWLLEWLRAHPTDKHGEPYYTPVGRGKIFHQNDIDRVELTLREEVKCHSDSGRRVKAKRRTSKLGAPISDAKWRLAAELTGEPSLSSSSVGSKNASRHTDNTQRPRLHLVRGNQTS
jgi:hypothetical protein